VGRERLITLHSGIYGWPGSRDLHAAIRADARGVLGQPDFVTTVDAAGVRTEINLRDNETAVIRRIPVTLQASGPVNVVVEQYDANGLRLTANGRGKVALTLTSGDFAIKPNTGYMLTTDHPVPVKSDAQGKLVVTLPLTGLTRLILTPTTPQ